MVAKRYFKAHWESPVGYGTIYHEFDGEEPTRQVERYGDRWFSSRDDYHDGLGPGLADQPLSESDLSALEEIGADEFEQVWEASGSEATLP